MEYGAVSYMSLFSRNNKCIGHNITLKNGQGEIIVTGIIESYKCSSDLISDCYLIIHGTKYPLSMAYSIIDYDSKMGGQTRIRKRTLHRKRKTTVRKRKGGKGGKGKTAHRRRK